MDYQANVCKDFSKFSPVSQCYNVKEMLKMCDKTSNEIGAVAVAELSDGYEDFIFFSFLFNDVMIN